MKLEPLKLHCLAVPKTGVSTFKKLEVSEVHLKVHLFRSGIFQNPCSKLEISSQYGPDSLKIYSMVAVSLNSKQLKLAGN